MLLELIAAIAIASLPCASMAPGLRVSSPPSKHQISHYPDDHTLLLFGCQARDEFHTWCSDGYMVKMNLSPSIFHPRLLRDPVTWWEWYGKKTPVLQQVAQRVLSIPDTSAGVERLFSVFKFIWSDRRNRLLMGRMWAMAYVYFNTRALRHLEEPMADDAADVARWEEWMASQPVEGAPLL
ncbi:hypothetical protein QJQ45_008632 [Haematococcus lacustris]|nr:hypothetical protein QJQ45_008632 [Haematococcus lacustris]